MSDTEENANVTVHLDVLGSDQGVVQMTSIGLPGEAVTIILRAEEGTDSDLVVTATMGAELGADLGGIEVLGAIAEAFHLAVQEARTTMVERLIQPTPPVDDDDVVGLEPTA